MVRPRAGHHMLVLPTPSHGLRMCVVSGFTSLDFEVTEVRNMCGARACLPSGSGLSSSHATGECDRPWRFYLAPILISRSVTWHSCVVAVSVSMSMSVAVSASVSVSSSASASVSHTPPLCWCS